MFSQKRFRKKIDMKPSYDSDGGSDYVDGVDSLVASKFNHRWNGEDVSLLDMEKIQQVINSALQNSLILSFAYPPIVATKKPFDYELVGMKFKIKPEQSGIIIGEMNKPKFTNVLFHDYFIDASNWTITGSSNLHEVQNDYDSDGENNWFRLGHDGGESPAVSIDASKNIGTNISLGKIDIKFKDFLNAPTGFQHSIQVWSSDGVGFIVVNSINGSTNYSIYYNLWNGSAYTSNTIDTGVARSAGLHTIHVSLKENSSSVKYVVVELDGTAVYTSSAGLYLTDMRILKFNSNNTGTSLDYFDIYRFTAIQESSFTLSANTINYVYIDLSDYTLKTTTTQATALSGLCLYCIDVPTGASSLLDSYVYDYRYNDKKLKSFYSSSIKSPSITGTAIAGTTMTSPQINRFFYVTTLAEFTAWMNQRESGDYVYIRSTSTIVYSYTGDLYLEGNIFIVGSTTGYPTGEPQNSYPLQIVASGSIILQGKNYFENIALSNLTGIVPVAFVSTSTNTMFKRCWVKGITTSLGASHATFIDCVVSGTLKEAYDFKFIGGTVAITLSSSSSSSNNENIVFDGCFQLSITTANDYGLSDLYYHKGIIITNCNLSPFGGVYLRYTKGSVISNCTFLPIPTTGGPYNQYTLTEHAGINIATSMDVSIVGNSFQRYSDDYNNASPITCDLIYVNDCKRITISGNSLRVLNLDADSDTYFNYIKLINIVSSSSINIVGNTLKVGGESGITNGPRNMWGIYISSSNQININDNIITMARYTATSPTNIAIYASTVVSININGNTIIFDNPYSTIGLPAADFGIKFATVTYALIIGNIIRDLSSTGSITYIDIGGSASVKPTTLTDYNYEFKA